MTGRHDPDARARELFDVENDVWMATKAVAAALYDRDAAICAMRGAGAYIAEIAGAAGMSRSGIAKILRRNGLR